MHKRHTEIKYTFPIYFNILIGQWDWIVKRKALNNKMIEMTVQVEFGGIRHQSMEKLNDICIASEMYEKHLKDSWNTIFEAETKYTDEDRITKDQWEDDGSEQGTDKDKELDRLMSDVGKERYDLSMRD